MRQGGAVRESLTLSVGPVGLAADRWPASGPTILLLHAGVADRRSWYDVADRLHDVGAVVAYDRRGFGTSPPSATPYRDLDDLVAVLDQLSADPVWLVGSSRGGRLALDLTLEHPERVTGLVLLAPAVSGSPPPEALDPATERLSELLEAAEGNLEETNRLETWLWLDGPGGPEGRVGGQARELALTMNAVALSNDPSDDAAAVEPGQEAWPRLEQLTVPTTVAWGDLDVPFGAARCEQLVTRIPGARRRVLAGTAHLPYLEQPQLVADLVREAVSQA